jgi:ubiquinone/menaquinone biosynthesis C-methylase UbiE
MASDVEAVRQEYDRLAADYDRRWRKYIDATLQAVTAALPLQGRERLLDLACGTGELERRLLASWPGLRIVGVDLSTGMLRQAEHKLGPRVTWMQAQAASLPFADHSFDAVVCANSFHYFRAPAKALHEAARVVRPGGSFILVDWCDDYVSCKWCSWWLRWTDPAFCRMYTTRECQALLEGAGFTIERGEHFRVGWIWGMMRFVGRTAVPGPIAR